MPDHGPRIHLSISSHGYGHLTQAIALAIELKKQVPDIVFQIQCNLSEQVIANRLGSDNFEHDKCSMDIGLIQSDPITPNLAATYSAYSELHENFSERIAKESKALQNWRPDLVISDIPYLPIAAAGHSGIPSVALASLTWDQIIKAYFDLNESAPAKWYAEAYASYREASLALLPTPAMSGDCFLNKKYIPPIIVSGKKLVDFRSGLNIKDNDNRPVILCSLGGIPGAKLPTSIMMKERDFHWLVNDATLPESDNIHNLNLCNNWNYRDVIASVDGVIGKPGYGMAVEAVAHGLPFVFFRRGHFPDEPFIIDWLNKNARVKEISSEEWATGKFVEPLRDLLKLPAPRQPLCNGAIIGASEIKEFFFSATSST